MAKQNAFRKSTSPPRQKLNGWNLSEGTILEACNLLKACNFQGKEGLDNTLWLISALSTEAVTPPPPFPATWQAVVHLVLAKSDFHSYHIRFKCSVFRKKKKKKLIQMNRKRMAHSKGKKNQQKLSLKKT